MTKLIYINKKGNPVELAISNHAVKKLRQRYKALYNGDDLEDPHAFILKKFSSASKVINHSKKEKTRLNRYGKDTIYFRCSGFTFVVQNATIVTIEISDKEKRHLNKCTDEKLDIHPESEVVNKPDIPSKLTLSVHYDDEDGNQKTKQALKLNAAEYGVDRSNFIGNKTLNRKVLDCLNKKMINPNSVWSISILLGKNDDRIFFDWINNQLC